MKLHELTSYLDNAVPLFYQEPYDNSGLQVGNPDQDVSSALLTLDITLEVLDEAIKMGCQLIISHHPLIFKPVKSITGKSVIGAIIIKAIENGIAIYSAHTNLDVVDKGVSSKMAEKLGLEHVKVLSPLDNKLCKIVTFVPVDYFDLVRMAIFGAGAGCIGNYDLCGFGVEGSGSFRGGDGSTPFVGEVGELHIEKEIRFETVFPRDKKEAVVRALLDTHPYEEPVYDIYPLENNNINIGYGAIGYLPREIDELSFLKSLSVVFGAKGIKYSSPTGKKIKRVALCGGSGSELLEKAVASGADVFVTADAKYHTFIGAKNKILLVDIGHYESEKFSIETIQAIIIKKFPNFALQFSGVNSNPINYL